MDFFRQLTIYPGDSPPEREVIWFLSASSGLSMAIETSRGAPEAFRQAAYQTGQRLSVAQTVKLARLLARR